jgi:hypothetical protein
VIQVAESKKSNDARTEKAKGGDTPGTGALCSEAQADGVPCFELGRECEECEKAAPFWKKLRKESKK